MKKLFLKLFFTLFIFSISLGGYASTKDSLVLYTKATCSNCKATKRIFKESGVYFIEKPLESAKNADEMLKKLSRRGFHGPIELPVIFLDNVMYHPAMKTDTGFVVMPLQKVVDKIKHMYFTGQIDLEPNTNNQENSEISDQNMTANPEYLICMNVKTKYEANYAMDHLIKEGYKYAGYMLYKGQYRVYTKFYFDHSACEKDLEQLKNTFENSYILKIKE